MQKIVLFLYLLKINWQKEQKLYSVAHTNQSEYKVLLNCHSEIKVLMVGYINFFSRPYTVQRYYV